MRLTVFMLLLIAIACDQPAIKTVADPDTGFKTQYTIRKDSVYHGPFTKTDSAGLILERGDLAEGKLQGIREIMFPNGQVKVRERYADGQITDLYEYFFDNGQVELKGNYIDGAMYGPWYKYDKEGNLLEIVTMVNNEELGPFTEYHPNGNLQAEGTYLHGPNEDGTLKLFDESGELYKTMLCDKGICVTTWEKK